MNFNEKLMELRKKQGLSQEALGAKVNVTRQTVSKWELGETSPELNKLIELAHVFGISIDELVGKETQAQQRQGAGCPSGGYKYGYEYEYISKRKIGSLPLVHIHVGHGIKKAKGIIAIGDAAVGVLAIGGFSLGIISIGGLGVGMFTLAGLAVGLLAAVGGGAVGAVAIGGFAVGGLAIGGAAIGSYAMGGFALAEHIAKGDYAQAHIAIGNVAKGIINCDIQSCTGEELAQIIRQELPNTPAFIADLFQFTN